MSNRITPATSSRPQEPQEAARGHKLITEEVRQQLPQFNGDFRVQGMDSVALVKLCWGENAIIYVTAFDSVGGSDIVHGLMSARGYNDWASMRLADLAEKAWLVDGQELPMVTRELDFSPQTLGQAIGPSSERPLG